MMQTIRSERGLTLTELTVVGLLATVVMLGLMGFYFNSQSTWLDGSTQAQTQRELTLVVEHMSEMIRSASQAIVVPPGDSIVVLYGHGGEETCRFWWDTSDSLVYWADSTGDHGPILTSKVERFQLRTIDTTLVELTLLQARTARGQLVRTSSSFALYNR